MNNPTAAIVACSAGIVVLPACLLCPPVALAASAVMFAGLYRVAKD
jgi:hypothetical protein